MELVCTYHIRYFSIVIGKGDSDLDEFELIDIFLEVFIGLVSVVDTESGEFSILLNGLLH